LEAFFPLPFFLGFSLTAGVWTSDACPFVVPDVSSSRLEMLPEERDVLETLLEVRCVEAALLEVRCVEAALLKVRCVEAALEVVLPGLLVAAAFADTALTF
jgi:hypothetical protein